MSKEITQKIMQGMFKNTQVQRALRRMERYTTLRNKEAALTVGYASPGYQIILDEGNSSSMRDCREVNLSKFYTEYALLFHTHTHPRDLFPMFSLNDICGSDIADGYDPEPRNELFGVSVVRKDQSLETLLWAPAGAYDPIQVIDELDSSVVNYPAKGNRHSYRAKGNRNAILKCLKEIGPAAFLIFDYKHGKYVPTKNTINQLRIFLPSVNQIAHAQEYYSAELDDLEAD